MLLLKASSLSKEEYKSELSFYCLTKSFLSNGMSAFVAGNVWRLKNVAFIETNFVNQQNKFNEINFLSHFACHVLLAAVSGSLLI